MISSSELKKIHNSISKNNFYILRNNGKFSIREIKNSLKIIKNNCLSKKNLNRDLKTIYSDPLKIKNYQRLLLGEFGKTETIRSHNYVQIINPLWAKDIYKIRKYFLFMCKLRNLLMGEDINFCISKPVKNLYSLTRIQYYPSGGGFMASHKDRRGQNVIKKTGMKNYIQILFLMSKKGEDFNSGGGFIVKNNKRIIHDDVANRGDIIIYNGKIEHGVETIDKHLSPNDDNKRLKGRFALLCNFYRTNFLAPKDLK